MKYYFACWPTPDQQRVLTKGGVKNRLISFAFLQRKRMSLIPDIVETGLADFVERPDEPIDEVPLEVQM